MVSSLLNDESIKSLFKKIDILRDYGIDKDVNIPQIVVIGNQSSGKSSTLESITGIDFPKGSNLCTKFPTQINIIRSNKKYINAYGRKENNKLIKFKIDNEREIGKLIKEAENNLCENNIVTDNTLVIEISKPDSTPLSIIDLPGYIQNTIDGQDENLPIMIENLINKFINQENTFILVVIRGDVDIMTNIALKKAREVDPEGNRTMCILTRLDCVKDDMIEDVIQIINNKKIDLKLGFHGIINKNIKFNGSLEDFYQIEEIELQDFKWNQIDDTNKTSRKLLEKISSYIIDITKNSLPIIINKSELLLGKFKKELNKLGLSLDDPFNRRKYFTDIIKKIENDYTTMLNGKNEQFHLLIPELNIIKDNFYKYINDNIKLLDEKNNEDKNYIIECINKKRINEVKGMYIYSVFELLIKERIDFWKYETYNLPKKCYSIYQKYINHIINIVFKDIKNNNLKDFIYNKMINILEESILNFEKSIESLFLLLDTPETYNDDFTEICSKKRYEDIKAKIDENTLENIYSDNNEYLSISLIIDINSYIKIENKTVVDIINKNITYWFIKYFQNNISNLYQTTDNKLEELIYDNIGTKKRRSILQEKIPRFEESIKLIKYHY